MKKLFFVFAVATSLVACNNAAETSANSSVDSARIADSIKAATPAMPTTPDSTSMKMDSAATKMDSAASKMADTTKKP